MKILHIYSAKGAGGAEMTMLSLASALEKSGIENVIASTPRGFIEREAAKSGIKTRRLRIRGSLDPFGIANLVYIVATEKPDIIHVHQGKLFWPAIFAKNLASPRVKLVFHRHADIRSSAVSRGHYRRADAVIAVSRKVAEGLSEFEKVDPSKIRIIYNGVSVAGAKCAGEDVRARLGLVGKYVVSAVGAVNKPEGKGQRYLVDAAVILKKKYADISFLVIGEGTFLGELSAYAASSGVKDDFKFPGRVENVCDYMLASDVVCLLSVGSEALGIVLIEAQMLGKPVIGTLVGGIPETLVDGKTGLLVPSRDAAAIASAIERLKENPQKSKEMGDAARKFASEKFDIQAWSASVAGLYRDISEADIPGG